MSDEIKKLSNSQEKDVAGGCPAKPNSNPATLKCTECGKIFDGLISLRGDEWASRFVALTPCPDCGGKAQGEPPEKYPERHRDRWPDRPFPNPH